MKKSESLALRTLLIVRNSNQPEHNVLKTGSVSVLRSEEGDTLLGPLERANLDHCTNQSTCLFHLAWKRKEMQFPERCVFQYLEFRTMDKVQWLRVLYTIVRTFQIPLRELKILRKEKIH
jgi:hypothetical protein